MVAILIGALKFEVVLRSKVEIGHHALLAKIIFVLAVEEISCL